MEIIKDLLHYFMERKKFWLLPVTIALLLVGMLIVFGSTSVVAPFIYSIF